MTAPQDLFTSLSREFALLCDPKGVIRWADGRAQALIGAKEGLPFEELAAPGTSDKVAALFYELERHPVTRWETVLLVDGQPATVSIQPRQHEGQIALVGSLVPGDYSDAFDQVSSTMSELAALNRETARQKAELQKRHDELQRLYRDLEDSHRGILQLHAEIDDKADALERTSQVRARFVRSMSHELRTPIHAILGLTGLLLDRTDGPLTDEQEKQVRFVKSSTESLSSLVDDMLDLAKAEAGKLLLRTAPFDLKDFLAAQRGMLTPLIPQGSPVKLVVEDDTADFKLDTDGGKVAQIVRNLVSNALKFTEQGEVRVKARLLPDDQVELTVRDTGIGIAKADQERIFEEFTQLSGERQQKVKGTGLGLSLSRRLAGLLGGSLGVESDLGQGATFKLLFPRLHHEVKETGRLIDDSQTLDPQRAPVLVVEDDRKTLFLYERVLSRSGFQIIPVRTVDGAREKLKHVRPAAIVLDVMLETESTWSFLSELKNSPATVDIPVLVVTVTNREDKARALGADEFWLKPIDPDRLVKRLRALSKAGQETRVLLIDDEQVARYLVRQHLQLPGYQVIEAVSGAEGLVRAREVRPSVIFLDLKLGDMSGFDVLDQLKGDPATRDIPVIITTSQILDDEERNRLAMEADAILSKQTLTREIAIARIRDALQKGLGPGQRAAIGSSS